MEHQTPPRHAGAPPVPGIPPVPILLVHPDVIVRMGLRALLEANTHCTVVRAVGDAADLDGTALDALGIGLCIHHLPRPVSALHDSLCVLAPAGLAVPLLLIGPHGMPAAALALAAGARGVLPLSATLPMLVQAVQVALAGGYPATPELQHLLQRPGAPPPAKQPVLSKREHQVLRWIAHPSGPTYSAIAVSLGLSVHTVHTYRDQLFKKLDVDKRSALVRIALELGYLDR